MLLFWCNLMLAIAQSAISLILDTIALKIHEATKVVTANASELNVSKASIAMLKVETGGISIGPKILLQLNDMF
jgi:hypothetical protein